MKLGLELLTLRPTAISLGTFFETWLATPNGTIKRSLGRDEYHLGLTIGAHRRVAATGRTHICQLDVEAVELGQNQARPALLVPTDIDAGTPLYLGMRTNRFLTLAALRDATLLRLLRDTGPAVECQLDPARIQAEEVAPGRYLINLGALLIA